MAHVWTDKYGALYDRTYRVLYDAGIDQALADELAMQRALGAALRAREEPFRRPAAEMRDDIIAGEFSRTRNVAASILLPRQARMEAHQEAKTENVRGSAT
jgi:hypothetical protein